jgi:hypothetical protein
VVGHQKLSAPADSHAALEYDASLQKSIVLLEELPDVEHDAVAQEATLALVEYPGRDLMEDELGVTDVDRVSSVRAALITSYDVDVFGQHIDDLPLAFITPLAPDDDGAGTLR